MSTIPQGRSLLLKVYGVGSHEEHMQPPASWCLSVLSAQLLPLSSAEYCDDLDGLNGCPLSICWHTNTFTSPLRKMTSIVQNDRTEDINAESYITITHVPRYYPPGAQEIIGRGSECLIGAIDEFTVLKYPCIPGNYQSVQIEAQLLAVLGSHPHIIASKGLTEHGLLLQRASNGSLNDYIASQPFIALDQKFMWCKQATEAISHCPKKRVIHCDISLRNLLLDTELNLLLADFQGMLKSADGDTLLDGLSRECSKSYQP